MTSPPVGEDEEDDDDDEEDEDDDDDDERFRVDVLVVSSSSSSSSLAKARWTDSDATARSLFKRINSSRCLFSLYEDLANWSKVEFVESKVFERTFDDVSGRRRKLNEKTELHAMITMIHLLRNRFIKPINSFN